MMGFSPAEINLQLMSKLTALDLPRASVPILLRCDDEAPEELATEELFENWLRKVRDVNKPAPKFRWKRSNWGRYCPVALSHGEIATGAPELSLAFLGKMYFFSNVERLEYFKINPRKYLLPAKPRNAVRVAVSGHAESGKSTLVAKLAEHYSSEVIDMKALLSDIQVYANQKSFQARLDEARESALAQANADREIGEGGVILNPYEVTDPIVESLIEEKMKDVSADTNVAVSPALVVEKLKEKINEIEKSRADKGEPEPHAGRWIIDGFPVRDSNIIKYH